MTNDLVVSIRKPTRSIKTLKINCMYYSQNQNFIFQSTFCCTTIEFASKVISPSHFGQRKRFRSFLFISLTSSNNQFSEFRISNINNELFVLIFLMILRTHFEASLRFRKNQKRLRDFNIQIPECLALLLIKQITKFRCKYSRFGIRKIGCSMT